MYTFFLENLYYQKFAAFFFKAFMGCSTLGLPIPLLSFAAGLHIKISSFLFRAIDEIFHVYFVYLY